MMTKDLESSFEDKKQDKRQTYNNCMNLNISYIYSSLSYSYKYYNFTNVFERNNSSVQAILGHS